MIRICTSILILSILSCGNEIGDKRMVDENPSEEIRQSLKELPTDKMHEITYDGCQYIIYKERADANSSYGFMAHKGNCSNPIHDCGN